MIIIENLFKKFEKHIIFENFNLIIPDNEFIILSGSSGCGKSTLLNMIGGLESINNGTINVNGYILKNNSRVKRDYYQKHIGFLFQNFALVDNKTVRQNLSMIHPKCRTEISMEQALEMVQLQNKINEPVYTLSGGEQQRVAIARLMLKQCDVVLIDEPTASLDWENAGIVMDLIKKIHKLNKTIVMVTHDSRLYDSADRVVSLKKVSHTNL